MAGRLSVGAILTLRDEMSARLDRARNTAKQFVDQIHAGVSHVDKFTSSVVNMGAKTAQHFGESAQAMLSKFFSVVKIGAGLAGAALGAMVFKGIEASMSFEAQIRHATGLLVASGATSDQADVAFKQFSEGILKMSPELAKSPEDLAKSLYLPLSVMVQYGNVGVSVTDTLKVVAAASKAATAGFADATTVTTALSRVLGAYGASADDAAHYTDIMQQAVNYGLMTFSDLAQGIGKVAGPAAALHLPFEQVAAAIATITRRGIIPDEAFTALNKFMLAVEKPHPEAIANLEAMFGPKWKDHFSATALAANGLSGVLDDLMGHVKPTKDQLAQLSQATDFGTDADIHAAGAAILGSRVDQLIGVIGDVRGLRGVLALTATDGATSFATALGLTSDSVGAVDKQFNEYRKTTQFAKDQFSSFIDVLKESVFGGVLPGLGDRFREMSASLAELTSSPIFQEADLGTKLKMIGSVILDSLSGVPALLGSAVSALWHGITGWWDKHQDEVKKDIQDFFTWLGDVAVPWAADAAAKLGVVLGPALLKSLAAVLSTPAGLATAGIVFGVKSGIIGQLASGGAGAAGSAESAAAMTGAAAELSGAAAALVSAAEALGGAAVSEEAAAGALATGGTGASIASRLFPAGVIPTLGALTISAAVVYFAAKVALDQKDQTRGAINTHDQSIADAMAAGDYAGVAKLMGDENRKKSGQSSASDWRDAFNQIVNQSGSPQEESSRTVQQVVDNTIAQALGNKTNPVTGALSGGDINRLSTLVDDLKSSGIWVNLTSGIQDAITKSVGEAQSKMRTAKAEETLTGLIGAGFDVSSIFGSPDEQRKKYGGKTVNELDLVRQQWAIFDKAKDWANDTSKNPTAFVDIVKHLSDNAVNAQPQLSSAATTYQTMADTLRNSNPALAAFYQTLADILGLLAGWKPSADLTKAPTGPGDMGLNREGIPNAIAANPSYPGSTPAASPSDRDKARMGKPFAKGGFGTVSHPTTVVMGDDGAEDFAFSPHSKGGMGALWGQGGGGVTVQGPLIGQATVREDADIEKIAIALAFELEKRAGNAARGTNAPA